MYNYTCARCKRIIEKDEPVYQIERFVHEEDNTVDVKPVEDDADTVWDLCDSCTNDLIKFMNDG